MAKIIPVATRLTTPVITTVPVPLRKQLEALARTEKISLSEIGRRALQEYVEKQDA